MQILLVRHGQSVNNKSYESSQEANRVADPGLTDLGVAQSEALAGWLAATGLTPRRLYASLMRRTIETAAPICERFGLPVEVREDLFENAGPFDGDYADGLSNAGSTRSELAGLAPEVVLPDSATETGWWGGPVETAQGALRRSLRVADWLLNLNEPRSATEVVVVVSHGAFLSMLLTSLLNPGLARSAAERPDLGAGELPVWFTFDNTATTLLEISPTPAPAEVGGSHIRVGWLNRIDHLAALREHEPSRATFAFPPKPGTNRAISELIASPPPHAPAAR